MNNGTRGPAENTQARARRPGGSWPLVVLIALTVANYVWQVPYYVHFYGRFGTAPGGLTILLVITFLWFLLATAMFIARRRGGVLLLSTFLVVEAAFYLVHNLSGAAGHDLPRNDVVLLIASLLGYLNALAALLFLGWLVMTRRGRRHREPSADRISAGPSQ